VATGGRCYARRTRAQLRRGQEYDFAAVTDMKSASIVLAVLASISGVIAAGFWLKSTTEPGPTYADFEPVETEGKVADLAGRAAQIDLAAGKMARLNRVAAILTIVGAILAGLSAIAGYLS
jgi:hypothetical protein